MKKKFKKPLSVLTSVSMALNMMSSLPVGASAEDGVPFLVRSWNAKAKTVESRTIYLSDYSVLDSGTRTLNGWYVVNKNVSFEDRLVVNGTANIVLCDGVKMYCEDGIRVSKGNYLNIYAQDGETGELYCDADTNDNAAIGADNEAGDCGEISIFGGKITADTEDLGTDGAGIGGGDEGNGGTVRIYGGTVKAKGGKYGAGIGGGDADGVGGSGGYTFIYGGKVEAIGGAEAAGIGGGEGGYGGYVEIWGGDVTATGGSNSAGIGCGDGTDEFSYDCYNGIELNIYGGTVKATGGKNGAGIGGGKFCIPGSVNIFDGKVTATGGESGAGIGGGYVTGRTSTKKGTINIEGGTVIANGGENGPGIGDGEDARLTSTVTVNGGDITATGGKNGAGIGGGYRTGRALIYINGGTVNATGGQYAPAIGSGSNDGYRVSDENPTPEVEINGGKITAKAGEKGAGIGGGSCYHNGFTRINGGEINIQCSDNGAGIGGGDEGNSGTINIKDGDITIKAGANAAGIGGGSEADGEVIAIDGGNIKVTAGTNASGIGGGIKGDCGNIVISGGNVEVENRGQGSGIGSGIKDDMEGTIAITGGKVTSRTQGGAAIGSGTMSEMKGRIVISGGEVYAYSNEWGQHDFKKEHAGYRSEVGAAIGSGNPSAFKGRIEFQGGYVYATCSIDNCAVGAARYNNDDSGSVTFADDLCVNSKFRIDVEYWYETRDEIPLTENREARARDSITVTISKCKHPGNTISKMNADQHYRVCQTCKDKGPEDHYFDAPTWKLSDDCSTATAKFVCRGCKETFTETASGDALTYEQTKDPSYTQQGELTYTGKVTFKGREYTGKMIKKTPKLDDSKAVVTYKDTDGSYKTVTATKLFGDETELKEGWYAVTKDTTMDKRIVCNGNVNLILCDGTNSVAKLGIGVDSKSSLTIWGQSSDSGKLKATGEDYKAGIGGNSSSRDISITINGGTIDATGGKGCAGIGSGYIGSNTAITINGGNVTAVGSQTGAGIGGSLISKNCVITINGGTVNATGGADEGMKAFGAGIGASTQNHADVYINGGDVNGYASGFADGIGGAGKDVSKVKSKVTLNYGDHGAAVYSNHYSENTVVTMVKPFANDDEKFAAGEYADSTVLAEKHIVSDDGMGMVRALAISLNGSIGIHFYMELSPEIEGNENAYMEFTVPGGDKTDIQTMKFAETREEEVNGKHTHVFVCYVPAKEMIGQISARLVNGDDKGIIYSFSVKEYGELLIDEAFNEDGSVKNEAYADAAPLVKAMLNYGAAAQTYFDAEAPLVLANSSLSEADKDLSGVTAETIGKSTYESDLPEGVKLHSATLSLKSETSLSLYFESEEELTFSLAHDHEFEVQKIDGYQVVRIRNISANELSHDYTVTVTAGGKTGTVKYSPMNYCYEALNGGTDNENLKIVARALYLYSKAADEYFTE